MRPIAFNLIAECNRTHVWNAAFDPHARFHIVWQLASNVAWTTAATCMLWLPLGADVKAGQARTAASLLAIEPAGFPFASLSMGTYGGSFFPRNVPEYDIKVLGVPVALLVFSCVVSVQTVVALTV